MDARRLGRPDDLIHLLVVRAECNVGFQGVGKQEIVLRHVSDIFAQCFERNAVDIPSVDKDHARLCVVEMQQQIDERRLAVSRAPDHGKRRPRLDVQADIL